MVKSRRTSRVSGLDQVKSVCNENAGSITIETVSADVTDEALQNVKNAVDRIASFPVGMEPPIVFKQDAVGWYLLRGHWLTPETPERGGASHRAGTPGC